MKYIYILVFSYAGYDFFDLGFSCFFDLGFVYLIDLGFVYLIDLGFAPVFGATSVARALLFPYRDMLKRKKKI
ncbi:hypothetical protein [Plasmodium yoelii yoelii]|uniref:Uncharacterized protein n=1 Tax=Plasmodium yoelii yoelii TaxID=73239 RepID=Q7RH39_PLAYO|nr:hypothetical protein [Plasmodium yoelii yoelii]